MRSSGIGIVSRDLSTYHMQHETKNFIKSVEAKIINARQPIYDNNELKDISLTFFGSDYTVDDPPLPYGYKIFDSKTDEFNEAYFEALDNYIVIDVVVTRNNVISVLENIIKCKRDNK